MFSESKTYQILICYIIKYIFFLSASGSWIMWEEYSIVDGGTPEHNRDY
jgi:hypothetical protein